MVYDSFAQLLQAANFNYDEWPILWDDRSSDKHDKKCWLECYWRPNGSEHYALGSKAAVDQGFFRVRVCIRRSHKRIKDMTLKAESLRIQIPKCKKLDGAYISETPEISDLDTDTDEMMTYLTVTFRYIGRMLK